MLLLRALDAVSALVEQSCLTIALALDSACAYALGYNVLNGRLRTVFRELQVVAVGTATVGVA